MSPLRKSPVDVVDGTGPDEPGRDELLPVLLAGLVDGDPERRRRAVLALSDEPAALPHLIDRVGSESDPAVREALCAHLARLDDPAVVDGLAGLLASDDAGLRIAAAGVLQQNRTATEARVPGWLADADRDVRILTVMVLAGLRSPHVERWLTDLVEHDPDPNVTASAIDELAALVGSSCHAVVLSARARFPDDPFIDFVVTRAMAAPDREPR